MAAAVPYIPALIGAAGTLFSASNQADAGSQEKELANYQASQLERNAGQSQAVAQRQAIEERRKARLLESRAQAVAAASGGGASDSTVVNLIGNIEKQGEYNALTALYNGDMQAANMKEEAGIRRKTGKAAAYAGQTQAASTILSGASSLYNKYG